MSQFWDAFAAANTAAIETMGEPLELDGVERSGIVDQQSWQEGAAPGGRKSLLSCKVLIDPSVDLRDGMPVKIRGLDGKVDGWESTGPGCHHLVSIGPVNRWSGDIPGL